MKIYPAFFFFFIIFKIAIFRAFRGVKGQKMTQNYQFKSALLEPPIIKVG